MTVFIDIIGAMILVGMVIIAIMNVNINMSDENYQALMELHTQTEAIQLARIFEFDLAKAGYHVPKVDATTGEIVSIADSTHIKFQADLKDNGTINTVEYGLGSWNTESKNPRDRMLFRIEDVSSVYINYSITDFKLKYYSASDAELPSPVTGAWRDSIKSIRVYLTLESPDPFDTTRAGVYSYASAMYRKLIYPRNL
jgi:hypothetical protein